KAFDLGQRLAGPFPLTLSLFSLCHCHLGKSAWSSAFRLPESGSLKAGLHALAMIVPINRYSTARAGTGIPHPTALITETGGEYLPLGAWYSVPASSLRSRFEFRVDHVVGSALLRFLASRTLGAARRGARVSGGRQARGQLL